MTELPILVRKPTCWSELPHLILHPIILLLSNLEMKRCRQVHPRWKEVIDLMIKAQHVSFCINWKLELDSNEILSRTLPTGNEYLRQLTLKHALIISSQQKLETVSQTLASFQESNSNPFPSKTFLLEISPNYWDMTMLVERVNVFLTGYGEHFKSFILFCNNLETRTPLLHLLHQGLAKMPNLLVIILKELTSKLKEDNETWINKNKLPHLEHLRHLRVTHASEPVAKWLVDSYAHQLTSFECHPTTPPSFHMYFTHKIYQPYRLLEKLKLLEPKWDDFQNMKILPLTCLKQLSVVFFEKDRPKYVHYYIKFAERFAEHIEEIYFYFWHKHKVNDFWEEQLLKNAADAWPINPNILFSSLTKFSIIFPRNVAYWLILNQVLAKFPLLKILQLVDYDLVKPPENASNNEEAIRNKLERIEAIKIDLRREHLWKRFPNLDEIVVLASPKERSVIYKVGKPFVF